MEPPSEKQVRLQKVLAHAGVASRRKSEELILSGRVTVNGTVVRQLGTKVDPERDEVRVDTVLVKPPKRSVTFLRSSWTSTSSSWMRFTRVSQVLARFAIFSVVPLKRRIPSSRRAIFSS